MEKKNYGLVFDSISSPILILNGDFQVIDSNSAAKKVGFSTTLKKNVKNLIKLTDKDIKKIQDPNLPEVTLTPRTNIGEGGNWYQIDIRKIQDDPQKPGKLLCVFYDVTELIKTDNSIQQDRKMFFNVIDFLPDPTFVIDTHGKVLAWNRAMADLTGIPTQDILGRGDFEYSEPFYGSRRPMLIDYIMNQAEDPIIHYPNFHKEGDTISAEVFLSTMRQEGLHLWAKATTLVDVNGNMIGAVETMRDVTELKKSQAQNQFLSTHDPVTGLFNRAYFDTEVARLEKSRRFPVSVLYCDLRSLKKFNDQRKYPVDDQKIREAARILRACFRQEDMVARLGLQEFGIIMPQSDVPVGKQAVQRVVQAVVNYNHNRPKSYSLLMAIGLSTATEPSLLNITVASAREKVSDMYAS